MTSEQIKLSLMHYFRFKRQWLCASECLNNDVMVITNKDIIEVEVKVNKYDLWKGEAKKRKHDYYRAFPEWAKNYYANRFYICVTEKLEDEAKKWVSKINKKYGIILCSSIRGRGFNIRITKQAKSLHDTVNDRLKECIMKRICSENIGLKETILINKKSIGINNETK